MNQMNVANAVNTIHRSTANLSRLPLEAEEAKHLRRVTDGVLSFTAYYLRNEKVQARPDQLEALRALLKLNDQLEAKYEKHAA